MSQSLIQNLTRNMLRRIVRRTVKRQKSAGTAEVFERSWSSLLSNPLYRWALRKYASDKDHFCMNTESLKFLTRTCPELFQAVKISAPPEFIDEIRSDTPFVAVQIHDGSPNLTKFISDHKRPFSRIVRDPERHMRRLKALQLETPYINLIKRDVRSFSRLRNAIQDRHIICCAIDYKDEDGKWAYLSPAIFGFAKQLMLPVIFIKSDVDCQGCVQIETSKPHTVSEPELSAMAFQEFYNSVPGKKIDLTVRKYS